MYGNVKIYLVIRKKCSLHEQLHRCRREDVIRACYRTRRDDEGGE